MPLLDFERGVEHGADLGSVNGRSKHLAFELLDFLFHHGRNPMLGQIDPPDIHTQRARDFLHRPLLDDVEIKDLIVLRFDLRFNPFNRGFKNVLRPFRVPDGVQIEARRVRDSFDGGCPRFSSTAGEIGRASCRERV